MPPADERDRNYEAACALGEGVSSNVYRVPERRLEDREGYPFAAVVAPPDVNSRFQATGDE